MTAIETVLLTGATGFVGQHLFPALVRAGYRVVGTSRDPESAHRRFVGREFRYLDVEDESTMAPAMAGCQAAIYLVHNMASGKDYEAIEARAARAFARAAASAGLSRIVYLGGAVPNGPPSRHLQSRIATGMTLRAGSVPTLELRAAMIIGGGSESWRIVRDLAARLPVMVLPRWLDSRSEPIAIDDVTCAIVHALGVPLERSAAFALPGPERLSAREILRRTARLLGSAPGMWRVPVVTPRLSSYWIRWVSRADPHLVEELVEGLRYDLLAPDDGFWKLMPEHRRLSFDEAARRALLEEARELSWPVRLAERAARRVGRSRVAG